MPQAVISDEIEITVSGLFSTHHHFQAGSESWGEMTLAAFARGADWRSSDGRTLCLEKKSWFGSEHVLTEGEDETVRGTSRRRGFFDRGLDLELDGRSYSLEPAGFLSMDWRLLDAEDTPVLEIGPRGMLRQGAIVTALAAVPVDLVVFAYYLYYVQQTEAAAGVAAAS